MSAFGAMTSSFHADVVVVGGGTVGAWTAVLLAESGAGKVVLLEAATLGDGASSRAAGMVRAQGGTEPAIKLGLRAQEFYIASGDRFPLDCGFVAQGYLMPSFTEAEVQQAHDRIALLDLVALGTVWLTRLDAQSTYLADVVGPLLLFGAGAGMIFIPLVGRAISGVAPEDSGAASGMLNVVQQVGGALGLGILVTIFGTASRNSTSRVPREVLVDGVHADDLVDVVAFLLGAATARAKQIKDIKL